MFDLLSYILGIKKGTGKVELTEGNDYTFKDENSDGNIEIEERDGGE